MGVEASLKSPGPVIGAWSIGLESGALTGAGTNTPIWSCRYTGTGLAVLERVALFWTTTTAFTAAQFVDHALFVARSFSASDSTGTAATLTGSNGSHRTDFPATGMGDMRISTTAALTAGTRTLDAQPIGVSGNWSSGVGVGNSSTGPQDGNNLYKADDVRYPVVLKNNEGLVINNVTAMGAAGIIKLLVTIEWKEMLNY